MIGESEIAAWELGAGCRDFAAAWVLNLAGIGGGLVFAPRRALRAFVRGRRSRSFYGADLDELLDLTVAEARERMGVDVASRAAPTAGDVARFGAAAALGLVVGTAFIAAGVVLAPVGLALNALRKRAARPGHQPA